jgi:L-fuculose-phosphate aldolase
LSTHAERTAVLETARKMSALGLSRGTSGNVSQRAGRGFVITPTGMPYDALRAEDLVDVSFEGASRSRRQPSSEWRLHRDLYLRRADVRAIVHCHPIYGTTLSTLRKPIPAVHYMIAVTGEAVVRCAPYATYGTDELSKATVDTLGGSRACLMANHGLLAAGGDLETALQVAADVETLAEIYWRGLQSGVAPHVLDDHEMKRVLEKFKAYGQASK